MEERKAPYQIIPRKYRPQTFASIVGQDAIVTTLKNALRFKRLAHAYLFCGARGTGKTTLARVFAKALNCSNLTENQEPCNACPSCLEANGGRSLDILEIDGASNRGIDDIRELNETVGYAPASGHFKIYIIDEVHMLTKEAFNALLKTLEEPPPTVKFFFATTEPHKVLATIVSRCQHFELNRIAPEIIQSRLAWIAADLEVVCDKEALALIAHSSEGCLRDAESLLDQVICYAEPPITLEKVATTLGLIPRSILFALDEAIATQNLAYAFELSHQVFSSGKDFGYFLDHLIDHFRTHLHIKLGYPLTVFSAEERRLYLASAARYTDDLPLSILDYLVEWREKILKLPLKQVGLEMILLHLIRSQNRIPLTTLVKRLIELEHTMSAQVEKMPLPVAPPVLAVAAPAPIETVELKHTMSSATLITTPLPVELPEAVSPPMHTNEKPSPAAPPPSSRYETLIRFAAVELEGVVRKEL